MSNQSIYKNEIERRKASNANDLLKNIKSLHASEKLLKFHERFDKHLRAVSDNDLHDISIIVELLEYFIKREDTNDSSVEEYKHAVKNFESLSKYAEKYNRLRLEKMYKGQRVLWNEETGRIISDKPIYDENIDW